MQGSNRDADVENGGMDMRQGNGGGMNWKIGLDLYTLPSVK